MMRMDGMTQEHCLLIIKLGGGKTSPLECDPQAMRIIHGLEHYGFRDAMYKWLIRRGITGKHLVEYNFTIGGPPRIADAFLSNVKVLDQYNHGGYFENSFRKLQNRRGKAP